MVADLMRRPLPPSGRIGKLLQCLDAHCLGSVLAGKLKRLAFRCFELGRRARVDRGLEPSLHKIRYVIRVGSFGECQDELASVVVTQEIAYAVLRSDVDANGGKGFMVSALAAFTERMPAKVAATMNVLEVVMVRLPLIRGFHHLFASPLRSSGPMQCQDHGASRGLVLWHLPQEFN